MSSGIFDPARRRSRSALVRRSCIAFAFFSFTACYAQKISLQQWTLQDSTIKQAVARDIIRKINRRLYDANPDAQLEREDDDVSIIVETERNTAAQTWSRSLKEVRAGSVIERDNLQQTLGQSLCQRLLERNYYWKGEALADPSDVQTGNAPLSLTEIREFKTLKDEFWWSPGNYALSLANGFARLSDRAGLFFSFGADELGYPLWNAGSFRVGVTNEFIKTWVQSPLLGNNVRNLFVRRKLDGGFGAGASFDVGSAGGELSYANLSHADNLSFAFPGKVNYVASIIQAYYILPLPVRTFIPGALRLKFGGGIHSVVSGEYDSIAGGTIHDLNRGVMRGGPYLKAEYVSAASCGVMPLVAVSLQYYNGGVDGFAAYQFADWLGIEAQASLFFNPDPWEEQFAWMISPHIDF